MKHEWKKNEKQFYLPNNKPELVSIPTFRYYTIEGRGNPNDAFFAEYISVLYSLSYGVKMSPKKGIAPKGYFNYVVYPLEGIWDISNTVRKSFNGTINKNELVFKLMIRQPDFVDKHFALQILEQTQKSKPHELFEKVCFEETTEGNCVQMLHIGSFDSEPESFKLMEAFAGQGNYTRISKTHKEIYLSDSRKVAPEKLKTVLRFCISKT
jgi:hypothetical protein